MDKALETVENDVPKNYTPDAPSGARGFPWGAGVV